MQRNNAIVWFFDPPEAAARPARALVFPEGFTAIIVPTPFFESHIRDTTWSPSMKTGTSAVGCCLRSVRAASGAFAIVVGAADEFAAATSATAPAALPPWKVRTFPPRLTLAGETCL